jgi:alkaline phosphatase
VTRKLSTLVSLTVALCLVSLIGSGCARPIGAAAAPKNVIILIGDGMGFEHVRAGGLYANGKEGSLLLETLPYRAEVVTAPVPGANAKPGQEAITDSAAAATALATGHKVYNGVISMVLPGDGKPYTTVLESFAAQGKMTGVVSTAAITDATPAAFGSHAASRKDSAVIADCYLKSVRPNVVFGGDDGGMAPTLTPASVTAAGYQVVTDSKALAALRVEAGSHVFGLFSPGNMPYELQKIAAATQPTRSRILDAPSLAEMTVAALRIVSQEQRGFFLMVEGALIDKAANKKGEASCIPEVAEFDKAVKVVMDWASIRKDTLVLVVADHETGGLKVVQGRGKGRLPELTWATTSHTRARVPLFAWGVGARKVKGTLDNTDVYRLMMGTFTGSSVSLAAPVAVPATVPAPLDKPVAVSAD